LTFHVNCYITKAIDMNPQINHQILKISEV